MPKSLTYSSSFCNFFTNMTLAALSCINSETPNDTGTAIESVHSDTNMSRIVNPMIAFLLFDPILVVLKYVVILNKCGKLAHIDSREGRLARFLNDRTCLSLSGMYSCKNKCLANPFFIRTPWHLLRNLKALTGRNATVRAQSSSQ
jgi:hypothetical protein